MKEYIVFNEITNLVSRNPIIYEIVFKVLCLLFN